MKYLTQDREFNCGQTCLAMITGKSIHDIETELNKKGKTVTADLKKVLKPNYTFPDRLQIFKGNDFVPELSIVKMTSPVRNNHWVVLKRGKTNKWKHGIVYDPALSKIMGFNAHAAIIVNYRFKFTSYLPLEKRR